MNILIKRHIISEFVKADGSPISGDEVMSQDDAMTTSPTSPPVTTDDYVKATRQGMSRYMYRSFYGEDDETNVDVEVPNDEKVVDKKVKKKLKKESREKMDSIIEDIFTKKNFDDDIVTKIRDKQISLNGIPDLESIRETNPILIRKVAALKDIIEKNNANGIEKAVILNFLLGTDMSDIPSEYKSELKKKIR